MNRLASIAARAKAEPVARAPRPVVIARPAMVPVIADDVDAGVSFFRGDRIWL